MATVSREPSHLFVLPVHPCQCQWPIMGVAAQSSLPLMIIVRLLRDQISIVIAAFLLAIGAFPTAVRGRQVKVQVSNANASAGGIAFSPNWFWPIQFDWNDGDVRGVGGPNSSVCAMDVPSRLSEAAGDSFSFAFRGVSAQLVFASRPDHAPFSVTYDGQTSDGDTYSEIVHCGAAWSSPIATAVGDHNLTCTNQRDPNAGASEIYLELLSILYDDGSGPPTSSTPTSIPTSTGLPSPSASAHGLSPGAVAGIAVGSASVGICAVLLAIFARRRLRRWWQSREQHDGTVDPLTVPVQERRTGARANQWKGGRPRHAPAPRRFSDTESHGDGARLADADVDRIAMRMNEMLDARVLQHGSESEGRGTSLPPY